MNKEQRNRYWDRQKRISFYAQGLFVFLILLLLILIPFILPGCKTCVPIIEVHDSIRIVEVRTRDTTIVTKADSASIYALLRCDSTNHVIMDQLSIIQGDRINANTYTQIRPDGGVLIQFDCKEDSLAYVVHMQDSIIKELSKNSTIQTIEVIPPFYKNCTAALWVLVAIIIAAIIISITIKSKIK